MDFRNVWKKHGPSPWIPRAALLGTDEERTQELRKKEMASVPEFLSSFLSCFQWPGERVGRGAMQIPTCQDLWSQLTWYWPRWRAMTPLEMALRARKKIRQIADAR